MWIIRPLAIGSSHDKSIISSIILSWKWTSKISIKGDGIVIRDYEDRKFGFRRNQITIGELNIRIREHYKECKWWYGWFAW